MRYRETGAPFEVRRVGSLLMEPGTRKPTSFFAGLLETVSRELAPVAGREHRGAPAIGGKEA